MAKVTHFEIPADDPERAMTFYGELLGWTFHPWGEIDYWLAQTGPDDEFGILGAIMRREAPFEGEGVAAYVCTMNVDDLDGMLARVVELGGTVVGPKQAVAGMGWHAYARDSEGNLFGMMQEDETAA
jgi:predicted enzyme related to lactoylglutathione lyase